MKFQPAFGTLVILAGLVLSACQPAGSLPVLTTSVATELTVIPAAESLREAVLAPTDYPEQPTAFVSQFETSQDFTPQPLKVDPPVIQLTPQVAVCSPLAGIALDELSSIISSPYDPPPAGKEDRHHGTDFSYYRRGTQSSIQGTIVQAILPGVVAMALKDSFPYGNVVIIESDPTVLPVHLLDRLDSGPGESLYTLYAHMEAEPDVEAGQLVEACQPIGAVGKSGNAGVAHLHLETRLGPAGVSFTQMGYYRAQSTEIEKENYLRWRVSTEFHHFNPMRLLSQGNTP